jgi:alanine racemase
VVKNNGYGLELQTLGPILDGLAAIRGFAVVKGDEALTLRKAGVRKPILLMGNCSEEEAVGLAEQGVHLGIYTREGQARIDLVAETLRRSVDVQLYIDTGMGRMGMPFREALKWMAETAGTPHVRVRGTFTALTEDEAYDRVQLRRFLDLVARAKERKLEIGELHAAASNGVFHLPASHLDLVRPGIALFGGYPSRPEEERALAPLRPAVRLCARVVRVAHLEEGDSVSYGRAWVADRPTWIATLPVGHADGYPREAVHGGRVLINGNLYPVIGAVTASHTVVLIGERPAVSVGDLATLMGPDHPHIAPNHLADTLGVSVYDLLMHLNPAMPRVLAEPDTAQEAPTVGSPQEP